jgi:hypothetical protein
MFHLYQRYPSSRQLEFDTLLREGLERKSLTSELKPGMRIAVGIGSRGIVNLFEIVTSVLNRIRASGAEPFIVPAIAEPRHPVKSISLLSSALRPNQLMRTSRRAWMSNRSDNLVTVIPWSLAAQH